MQPHLVLPVGTRVVSRVAKDDHPVGSVGVIRHAPTDNSHSYQIELVNQQFVTLKRGEFSICKSFQKEGLSPVGEHELFDYVIYRCVIGSRAYGLDDENSDTDVRGVYLPPAEMQWSLYGVPEQIEDKPKQECYWELQKFIGLALKANPNILECLYTPMVLDVEPIAQELLDIRSIFLSKLVYQTYNNYVISQFKKMEQDLRTKGKVRPKHAMHLIRLLLSGIHILKSGFVAVEAAQYRDRLLAIKHESTPWDVVNQWRLELHREFETAFIQTRLPDRPDYQAANNFLIKARQEMVLE